MLSVFLFIAGIILLIALWGSLPWLAAIIGIVWAYNQGGFMGYALAGAIALALIFWVVKNES